MLRRFFRVLACALTGIGALSAHEIGATRVSVLFSEDSTYHIAIVTDATALNEKLQASTGQPPVAETAADRLEAMLTGFDEQFRRRVKLQFDGEEDRPAISYSVTPASDITTAAPAATIRLTGKIPPGARQFTWTYSWTFASYSLMLRTGPTAQPVTEWLEGGESSKPFDLTDMPPPSRFSTAWRYLTLGFTHILPHGLDHMLFVLGIYLLSRRMRSILWQVSAFTAAHSITLGLSMYGIVSIAPSIVEPLIALSIAYVAVENIFLSELRSWRVALVFAFGLLHGLGFAGALSELGLPRGEFATALLTFNLGVEFGQLAVIGAAFLLVGWRWSERAWYRGRVVVPASAMIACMAVYWTVERLLF